MTGPITSRLPRLPPLSVTALTALVSLWCLAALSLPFWTRVLAAHPAASPRDWLFLGSVGVLAFVAINLFLTVFAWRAVARPALALVLVLGALAAYFAHAYGVFVDKVMIRNVFETDTAEAAELLTWRLAAFVGGLGVLPAWLVLRAPLRHAGWRRELLHKAGVLAGSVAAIGLVAAFFYQDHAALLRNHREIRHVLVPVNYLSALGRYGAEVARPDLPYEAIGADARRGPHWNDAAGARPALLVIVVGETARAANFSLGGYARRTNPELESIPGLVYFSDVAACGTSTAVSLPCMFSDLGRARFDNDRARARDDLLDVLVRAGFEVHWYENNSGCKGICRSVAEIRPRPVADPAVCRPDECHDEILLRELAAQLADARRDHVIVLHTHGSHGPGYHLRYPPAFERFTPVCRDVEFARCSTEEIVNAYDNTILYTDHVVASAIRLLEASAGRVDGALLYVSDHGESLGEHGLFLHGVPYAVAPDTQTRVPMVFWSSPALAGRLGLDLACLASHRDRPLAHDHLFHSVLALLDVRTRAADPARDLFAGCRR